MADLKEILEALIFVHSGPLEAKVMENILKDDYSGEEIRAALEELREDIARREIGCLDHMDVVTGDRSRAADDEAMRETGLRNSGLKALKNVLMGIEPDHQHAAGRNGLGEHGRVLRSGV